MACRQVQFTDIDAIADVRYILWFLLTQSSVKRSQKALILSFMTDDQSLISYYPLNCYIFKCILVHLRSFMYASTSDFAECCWNMCQRCDLWEINITLNTLYTYLNITLFMFSHVLKSSLEKSF